ncbi:lipoprotein [Alishewanella sp. WH16-1]|uniref:hypothetical protein n=1 Tax=Alishewanella sp. WH16-1 TaxID=1651088 RepID=UPI00070A126D|nr:hypothetical protein [Alishewanella sp. WH16-1]KRS21577.1 lipoprotein [Alishewanella sp. WH16-1]
MKILLLAIIAGFVLTGCDSANNMIDKAQEAANQKVESLQKKIESFNLESLNSELFNDAPALAALLTTTVNDALNADFSNVAEMETLKGRISNVYACLVEQSSDKTAQDIMQELLANMNNADVRQLIQSGVDAGKAKQCIL